MRKRFLATLLCLLSLCTYGYAQKGLQSVGMDVSYNHDFNSNKGLSFGVKYHYYLSNYIRVSPTIKWVSMKEVLADYNGFRPLYSYAKTSGLDVSVDFQWFIIPPYNRLRPYLITGVSSGYLKAEAIERFESQNEKGWWSSKFALNYGIGLNWEISPAISLQFETTRREEISNNSRVIFDAHWFYSTRPFTYIQIAIGAVYNF